MTQTCEPQVIQWWTDRCADCDHLLAAHRDFGEEPNAECSLCSMQKTLEDAIAANLTAAKEHADEVGKAVREHVTGLVDVEMPAVVEERVKPEALK